MNAESYMNDNILTMINNMNGYKTKNDMSHNLYTILSPFYANLANNSKSISMRKMFANNQMFGIQQQQHEHDHLIDIRNNNNSPEIVGNSQVFNRNMLGDIRIQNHNDLDKLKNSNLQQITKSQNLNKIVNKIHNFKQTNDNKFVRDYHAQNEAYQITKFAHKYPDQLINNSVITRKNDFNGNEINKETPQKKTVRQLLGERQSYLEKLQQNQFEIIKCQLNVNNETDSQLSTDKNGKQFNGITGLEPNESGVPPNISPNISPRQHIPEMIDIDRIRKRTDKNDLNSRSVPMMSQINPKNFKTLSDQSANHANFAGVPRYYESEPKKCLTVRQLLERKRNSDKPKSNHHDKMPKRKSRSVHHHPYLIHNRNSVTNLNKDNQQNKFLNEKGLNPNNPIVLSDEESEVSSIKSNTSLVTTDISNFSEPLAQPLNNYDLSSEHNYSLDTNLVIRAKQVVIGLNNEINFSITVVMNEDQDKINKYPDYSVEQKESLIKNLYRNHKEYEQKDFASNLSLIKSRDLKRIPIAYLNAKYPQNEISRSIYAGLETKNAVLDFPKSQTQTKVHKNFGNNSKHKILDYKKPKFSDNQKKVSNNWSKVLANLDFSSPLSQKIIKIFPEYQSKRAQRKTLKIKLISK